MNRRIFLKKNLVATTGLALAPALSWGTAVAPEKKARIGFLGVGLRGTNHLRNLLKRDDVLIPAICDIDPERIKIAQELIAKAGHKKPETYTSGDHAYLEMLKRKDLDGVIIATPWEWHTPMAVAAMKAGKRPGVEVSAANTIEECWDLVNTSEETGVPCMILENSCYRRDVMAVLNMVRSGLFGELLHCECGYLHDLRAIKVAPGAEFGANGQHEAKWRTNHSVHRNGDLYPTHGIGPVANLLNINRGNKFLSLTSVATKARGLHEYIVKKGGENHQNAKVNFKLGDIVTTVITTQNGETIVITHDTNLPRPKTNNYLVQGTNGLWMYNGNMIYVEGKSPEHQGEVADKYMKEFDHVLWQKSEDKAKGSGHTGNDYFVLNGFVESVKRQTPPPLDVYDAAAWSVITPLSEMSVAAGGAPQPFPDFTRGNWINRKPTFGLNEVF
ncbi:alpha-N-acetylgalactosaminidase [Adhaeribacter aerolatus]|uniref:Alpha-N-acetylgalactosaminidase n=1 Tax=Adhaeribacter aerolatus TaxID=670289 RepID=A0A512B3E6_9BACT|nr:Gfo/Idh/MocA family oxidoreductase [Adhaeribacter aerolatus]GEO06485.1 alpha-N-acetylgalactosaminidase [Adhaeribacter aerolatus]